MRGQRPTVVPGTGRAGFSVVRRLFRSFGQAGRLDLLSLLEPEFELLQWQALGPSSEAMAL